MEKEYGFCCGRRCGALGSLEELRVVEKRGGGGGLMKLSGEEKEKGKVELSVD